MKKEYLDFYKVNFESGKYCTKSWGFACYEAGKQSSQAEVDKLVETLKILKCIYLMNYKN